MSTLLARVGAISCLFILAVGLLLAYHLQLAERSEHLGYQTFSISLPYVLALTTSIFFLGLLVPAWIRKPSDFFGFLCGLFVSLPCTTLRFIRNLVGPVNFMVFFLILATPFIAIRIGGAVVPIEERDIFAVDRLFAYLNANIINERATTSVLESSGVSLVAMLFMFSRLYSKIVIDSP